MLIAIGTTGFIIKILGTTVSYGSRTQETVSLSSSEAELYAINTGATEALYLRNLLMELLCVKHVNIKIHTDSSSGKSMETLALQEKPNTLNSNTFLSSNWS